MNKEFTFKLEKPIACQIDGENTECFELVCTAPSYNNRKQCTIIKELFFNAVKENRANLEKSKSEKKEKKEKEEKEEEIEEAKGSDYINLFYQTDADTEKFMEACENLITSGVCKAEGRVQLNKNMLSKMSFRDTENLFGEYMNFFLIES